MVTSPNWMAPFHIARATAGPRAGSCRAGGQAVSLGPGRVRTIARTGNHAASRQRARASPEDDERVQVDPAGSGRAELDRVRAERRERGREEEDALVVDRRAEADRGPVDAVD